jgi:hypothetical protein
MNMTELLKQKAVEMGLEVIDIKLIYLDPEDFVGIPVHVLNN